MIPPLLLGNARYLNQEFATVLGPFGRCVLQHPSRILAEIPTVVLGASLVICLDLGVPHDVHR